MTGLRKPVAIGGSLLPGNIFLAPVAGYTDRIFRGLCVDYGADFTFTELVSSEALARIGANRSGTGQGGAKTLSLLERAANETRLGIQLFGADPEVMARAVPTLAPFRPFSIDINAGCPVPKVVKTGAGAALMKTPARLGKIVGAVVKAVERLRPTGSGTTVFAAVTVKIRSGWDTGSRNYAECARIARDEGAAMITLHARTRAQGYGGTANWDDIARLAREMDIPVCGSGDLFTAEDAQRMLSETGCAAVMFARGALGNPFIFEETRFLFEGRPAAPVTPQKRADTALSHLRALAAASGEEAACRAIRAHFCHYIKGIPNAAAIRNRLVQARTVREYEEALRLAARP